MATSVCEQGATTKAQALIEAVNAAIERGLPDSDAEVCCSSFQFAVDLLRWIIGNQCRELPQSLALCLVADNLANALCLLCMDNHFQPQLGEWRDAYGKSELNPNQ